MKTQTFVSHSLEVEEKKSVWSSKIIYIFSAHGDGITGLGRIWLVIELIDLCQRLAGVEEISVKILSPNRDISTYYLSSLNFVRKSENFYYGQQSYFVQQIDSGSILLTKHSALIILIPHFERGQQWWIKTKLFIPISVQCTQNILYSQVLSSKYPDLFVTM